MSRARCVETHAIEHDHTEAITLALHDDSPQHLMDAMADDVVLELGWGRLIFGQTFADPEKLAVVLAAEGPGRRDICIYARESHVLIARAPNELFIDPSHTYRLRFGGTDDTQRSRPTGRLHGAHAGARRRRRRDQPGLRALRDGARADAVIWDNHLGSDAIEYLVAVRDDDGAVMGTVTGVDHERLFGDPEGRLEPVDAGGRSGGRPARASVRH